MTEPAEPAAASAASARCAAHPDVAATGVCSRCGDYHCAACQKTLAGRTLCARCRELPGIDYLEETRARFWGKRDAFVWFYGVFGVLAQLITLVRSPALYGRVEIVGLMISMPIAIAYFMLLRPARIALVAVNVIGGLVGIGRTLFDPSIVQRMTATQLHAVQSMGGKTMLAVISIAGAVIGVLFAAAAYRSPRNKLAFKIDIDERGLQRVYDTYVSNSLALRAAWFSLIGFVPFASVITLVMGIVALQRAEATAWPPRGGRLPALIAIGVSLLCLLGWGGLFASIFLRVRAGGSP